MKKHLLKICLLSLVAGSLIIPLKAENNQITERENRYEETQFYAKLSDNEKQVLKHLVEYHHDAELSMAMQAVSAYEKMLTVCAQDSKRVDISEKLTFLNRVVREKIRATMNTRPPHGAFFTQILNCCTPRDAYFREVVTEILTVTGDATIAGNLTIGGDLIVSGTVTQENLMVTGTIITGRLIVLDDATINGDETIAGNLLVGGTLTVTGSSTLSSLSVSGGTNLGTTTVSTLNVVCNETVGCNLNVTGTTTTGSLSVLSNASIVGNETIGGTLTVTGSSTFNNPIGVTSTSGVTAATINESGGTGVGLAITGNTSQPTVILTQGAGQNAVQAGSGTVTAPSYSFIGSTTTGLYSPAANRFALSAAGANKVNYDGLSVLVTSTYRFSAVPSGDLVTAPGVTGAYNFNVALINGPGYDNGLGRYNIQVSGVYLIMLTANVSSDVASDIVTFFISKNGDPGISLLRASVEFPAATNVPVFVTSVGILPLEAGDFIQVLSDGSNAGNITLHGPSESIFGAHLLSVN